MHFLKLRPPGLRILRRRAPTARPQHAEWNPGVTFALSLVALCPLAERINFLTEQARPRFEFRVQGSGLRGQGSGAGCSAL